MQRASSDQRKRWTTPVWEVIKDLFRGNLHVRQSRVAARQGRSCNACCLFSYTMKIKGKGAKSHWWCVKPPGCFPNLFTFYLKGLVEFPIIWSAFLNRAVSGGSSYLVPLVALSYNSHCGHIPRIHFHNSNLTRFCIYMYLHPGEK